MGRKQMEKQQITVIYGDSPLEMTKYLLQYISPAPGINKHSLIGIKPNLVKSVPSASGATTSPDIVRGIIEYFQAHGFKNIIILESSWIGDRTEKAFKVCGYDKIAAQYGIPLVDLKKDPVREIKCNGELTLGLCKTALAVDYLINVPVLKAHCQTRLTCALKNLKGCIPDSEKREFHRLGLHNPIAYLNRALRNSLIIVDGIRGDLTHEEGGNPVEMGRIIGGFDPVLIDSYAASLLGYRVDDVPYIRIAKELGVGHLFNHRTPVTELNADRKPRVKVKPRGKARYLAGWIEEKEACSPCYGHLIHALRRLEEARMIDRLTLKVCIGQGFKGIEEAGYGIGNCTKGLKHSLPGCPPSTTDIIKFLSSIKI